MINQTLNLVTTEDHQKIAVWKVTEDELEHPSSNQANRHKKQNLLFIHGAFSDKNVCMGIASYFAAMGHQCFIMEWRGHGDSSQPQTKYHLEDIGLYDVKATLDYLLNTLNLSSLHCITHSGGGLCLTICLTQYHEYDKKIKSITMFACQAFASATTPLNFANLIMFKAFSRQMGIIKGRNFKLGTMNESYYLLSQWMDWNLNQNFATFTPTPIWKQLVWRVQKNYKLSLLPPTASQAFDYRSLMPEITSPIYAICAKNDNIASPYGCLKFLQAFKNSNNQYREFSRDNGDSDDYNHTRIFLSSHAAKEVWPTVLNWVERHC